MRLILLLLTCQFTSTLWAANLSVDVADQALVSKKYTNALPLIAGSNDANIARLTGLILERYHYSKHPLNDEVSSKFLDRYLNALDNVHIYFLQSDLAEFEGYRSTLDDLTSKKGDTEPARVIFTRFRERLNQQFEYVSHQLTNEAFEFKTDERVLLNRRTLPRPKDLAEAEKLWRERLRYEYLQEKLNIGQPEAIAELILDKLKSGKPNEVASALREKMSKAKAEEISKLIAEKSVQETPEATVRFVREKLERDNAEEIVKIISRRYTRILRAVNEYDNDDVLQIYLSALTHVYDPHSDYMGKSESENFSISMKLSLFGIGALLRSEDGFCKIQSLMAEGPAERSKKLKANDRIIAVAQGDEPPVEVVEMKLNKVVELIRGPKGTEVRLTIIPADAADPSVRRTVSLLRDEIKLEDQAAKAKIYDLPVGSDQVMRMGVIDLPSFYAAFDLDGRRSSGERKSTTTDVAKLLKKLKGEKVSGIILDLRRNGGGSLEEAINLTGLFIKEGPVVQVKGPDGNVDVDNDTDPSVLYDGPLIVLTSRFSASASEILAGALQDYGRALIVGDSSTHGKGTVQSFMQLGPLLRGKGKSAAGSDPGAIKITIKKFYRASGSSTQLEGVIPDIVLPSLNNHAEIGEKSLDDPLPWDTIASASYEKLNRIEPVLPELKKRAEARVAADQDFTFLREEIERYKKTLAEKSVSLNEAQRLKEKKEADERSKARKKEMASRPENKSKVYEITLKNADLPGLPEPVAKTNSVKTAKVTPLNQERKSPTGSPKEEAKTSAVSAPELKDDAKLAETKSRAATPPGEEDLDEAAEDKLPANDIMMNEAQRILADLVQLLSKQTGLAAKTPASVEK